MPINKAEIRTLIPHSDLMCLVDEVVQWDDRSIACVSNTHRDPANPLRRQGRLSAVHAFEYGAQAAAVHGGLRARAAGTIAPPGYLAALRDGRLHVTRLDYIHLPLRILATRLYGEGANTVYEFILSAAAVLVAEGRVTIVRTRVKCARVSARCSSTANVAPQSQRPYRTSHRDAAIDTQHLARNVSGFWRCEEFHRGGNFLRRPGPAEWDFAVNRILNLIG